MCLLLTLMKIAVVQFEIFQFQPEKNLAKAKKFIEIASMKKADLIVFPEDFVTGPILGKKEFVDFNKKYLGYFKALAKKYSINILPGSWIEGTDKGWFNTTYFIDSKGNIKSRYQKINLWKPERKYLNYGNQISVFNTKFGKIGIIICWDLIFPEIFRKIINSGAKIIICPSYWTKEDAGIGLKYNKKAEIKLVDSLCTTRAFENNIMLIYCNAAGQLKYGKIKDKLIGHSQITIPFKGIVKVLNHNREEMFISDIDLSILKDSEKHYLIKSDLKKRILF